MTDTVSNIDALAATTKAPVAFVFGALSVDGTLESQLIEAGKAGGLKEGSIKSALNLLISGTAPLVLSKNAKTGKKGRPPKLYFRAGDFVADPAPVVAETAPVTPAEPPSAAEVVA